MQYRQHQQNTEKGIQSKHKPLNCKSASKNPNILEGLILKLLGQQGQPCYI